MLGVNGEHANHATPHQHDSVLIHPHGSTNSFVGIGETKD